MLFMGQEFAASTPFMFFADHKAELRATPANGLEYDSPALLHQANCTYTAVFCGSVETKWRQAFGGWSNCLSQRILLTQSLQSIMGAMLIFQSIFN
jgi:hypothetical protein